MTRVPLAALVLGLSVAGCSRDRAAEGVPGWRLVEDLRIGGADTGAASFNDVRGLAVTPAGGILVLDFQSQEIRLFDSAGRFAKLVARRGEGPGELANANGMAVGPGGLVIVNDPQNGRFSVYDGAGTFVGQHVVPGWGYGYRWAGGVDTAGRTYEEFYVRSDTVHRAVIRRFSPDFARADTLPARPCAADLKPAPPYAYRGKSRGGSMQVPYTPTRVGYLDPRGLLWCARSDRDEVVELAFPSGDTLRTIRGSRAAVPITAAERDSAVAHANAFAAQLGSPAFDLSRIGAVKPIIRNLTTDDQGRLWVLVGTADTVSIYDLYAADGSPLATVRAGFNGASDAGWHPLIRGDRFYTLTTDADGVPAIVRAHLERTS